MRLCARHWGGLRDELDERGLTKFIAQGETQRAMARNQIRCSDWTAINFCPLMCAHQAICWNIMQLVERAGGEPFALVSLDDCPLCEMQALHDERCDGSDCELPAEGYDYFLGRGAEDAERQAKELGLI